MRYALQFLIILAISETGEVLKALFPLPLPASIYGLLLLFLLLYFHLLPLSLVKETGDFLIQLMPLMFIPPAVGIIDSWLLLTPFLPFALIIVLSTILVMSVSGLVCQKLLGAKECVS